MANESDIEPNPYAAPATDPTIDLDGRSRVKVSGIGNFVFLLLGGFISFIGISAIMIAPYRPGFLSGLPTLAIGTLLVRHGLVRHRSKPGYVGFSLLWLSVFLIVFFFFVILAGV